MNENELTSRITNTATLLKEELRKEWKELDRIKAQRRAEEVLQSESAAAVALEATKKAEKASKDADAKMAKLLLLQVEADERKERRRIVMNRIGAGLLAVILPSGAYGGLQWKNAPEGTQAEDVDKRVAAVEQRQVAYGARINRLADLHFEQLDVVLAADDQHTAKLDAILKQLRVVLEEGDAQAQADAAKRVATLTQARKAVSDYKALKRQERQEQSAKSGDPFKDLPVPAAIKPLPKR